MGKKRKLAHGHGLVVEESREPAAYTLTGSRDDKQLQQQCQQQELQKSAAREGEQPVAHENHSFHYSDDVQVFHQSGEHGGSRVDPSTLSYLTEVCEALAGVSDAEEAQLLRSNVLEEITGKELQLAMDAASSTLMEQLLSSAPLSQLLQFMGAFTDSDLLWRLAGSAFGSHVAEKTLAWIHAAITTEGPSGDAAASVEPLLEALISALEPHVVDYATDRHATHVARALLVVVAGRDVLTPPGKKQRQRQQQQQVADPDAADLQQQKQQQQQQHKGVFGPQRSSLAEKMQGTVAAHALSAARYPTLLRRMIKAMPLFDPQQVSALGKNTYGGPLLQAMLRAAAHDESLLMQLLPPILGLDPSKAAAAAPGQRLATLTDSHVGRLLRDDCYSHLLEVAVAVMPQSTTAHAAPGLNEAGALAAATGVVNEENGQQDWQQQSGSVEVRQGKKRRVQQETENAAASALNADAPTGPSLADEFYERFLKGRLLPLCCHHCANFVIQAVFSATSHRTRVAAFVSELAPHLADLLKRRRSGVVAALAAAAARSGAVPHQQQFVTALVAALGLLPQWQGREGTAHLAPALMTLDTQAVLGGSSGSSGSSTRLSTPGCAVLALLLGQYPPAVVSPFWQSLGALPRGDVVRAAQDPAGSRLLEGALTSSGHAEGVTSKRKLRKLKKQKATTGKDDPGSAEAAAASEEAAGGSAASTAKAALLAKLKSSWGAVAQVPAGSFLLEAVYNSMPAEEAEGLVAEVAAVHDQLMSRCSWGPFLSKKLSVEAYLRSPEEWRKRTSTAATIRREFKELLETPQPPASKPQASDATQAAAGVTQHQQHHCGHQAVHTEGNAGEPAKHQKKRKRAQDHAAGQALEGHATAALPVEAADSNASKRARLAAAALAAAEDVDGSQAAGPGKVSKKDKKKRKRQVEQPTDASAGGAAGDADELGSQKRPKKKAKTKLLAGSDGTFAANLQAQVDDKRKRPAVPQAAGCANGVDFVALLSFGGMSSEKAHDRSKLVQL